jgi:hypothetical protein
MNTCGCHIDRIEGHGDDGRPVLQYQIRYCALHGAAPVMLEAITPLLAHASTQVRQCDELLASRVQRTAGERRQLQGVRHRWQALLDAYGQATTDA